LRKFTWPLADGPDAPPATSSVGARTFEVDSALQPRSVAAQASATLRRRVGM
jgi:hypothetical protein